MKLHSWLKGLPFLGFGLSAQLDTNRAHLARQRDEINHSLEALKIEKRAANLEAAHAQADFVSARSKGKEIDRRREASLRQLDRVEGALALLKRLEKSRS